MTGSLITIITAGTAALVTIAGWNVSHYLAKKREDRTRRIEMNVNRLERQLEEFYGPLLSLIEQIFNVWRVRKKIFESVNEDEKRKIDEFVWKEYFLPLHIEIRELLKVRFYLVDDENVVLSIKEYLEHSTQELFQNKIGNELHIDTSRLQGKRWPGTFHANVVTAILEIKRKRDTLIKDLEINMNI